MANLIAGVIRRATGLNLKPWEYSARLFDNDDPNKITRHQYDAFVAGTHVHWFDSALHARALAFLLSDNERGKGNHVEIVGLYEIVPELVTESPFHS